MLINSIVGEVVPENVVSFAGMEDVERSLNAGDADVSDVGLVVKSDETLILENTVCVVKVAGFGGPLYGATVGAERMGVSGPTVGIPHATPPGYMVTIIAVILLLPKVTKLEVVIAEVRPVSVL